MPYLLGFCPPNTDTPSVRMRMEAGAKEKTAPKATETTHTPHNFYFTCIKHAVQYWPLHKILRY